MSSVKYIAIALVVTGLGAYAYAQQPTPPVTIGIEQRPDAGKAEVVVNQNRPEATLKKWNGEANLKVSIPSVAAESRRQGNTFRYGRGNEQVVMRELENGFKIDIVSHTNQSEFVFELDNIENLDFFHQPPLDEEHPEAKNCSPTECDTDGDGEIDTRRPEHIVDSYAVYHKTKKNHVQGQTNYATGKAYHIERIKVIDANGEETWGYMDYADGQLTVGADPSWVSQAAKPVTYDPTFGFTSVGGTNGASSNSDIWANAEDGGFVLESSFEVTEIQMYLSENGDATGDVLTTGIYKDNGSDYPGDKQLQSGQLDLGGISTGWKVFTPTTNPTLSSGDYYIAYASDSGGYDARYDTVTSWYLRFIQDSAGPWQTLPDPFPSSGDFSSNTFDRRVSIYATYTASADNSPPAGQAQFRGGEVKIKGNVNIK